jgi:hypothetical protein
MLCGESSANNTPFLIRPILNIENKIWNAIFAHVKLVGKLSYTVGLFGFLDVMCRDENCSFGCSGCLYQKVPNSEEGIKVRASF